MEFRQDHLEAFHRDGFAGPFTLFDPDTAAHVLGRIREEILPVRSQPYAHTIADIPLALYGRDRHLDSPLLYRVASAPEILSRLPALIGPNVHLWRSDMFDQGPGDPATYPHQDVDLSGTRVITSIRASEGMTPVGFVPRPDGEVPLPLCASAWIALTRMRADVGTLWVVPGTHTSVVPEVPGEGFANRPLVLARDFQQSEGVPIEVEAGQFILFHNLLVHASFPSRSGRRFAWTTRYVSSATKIYHGTKISAQGQDLSRWGALLVLGQDARPINVMRAPPVAGRGPLLEERALDHRPLADRAPPED